MTYDTIQFYNFAMAVIVGCCAAPIALSLIPPLSPDYRMRRLIALSDRDI